MRGWGGRRGQGSASPRVRGTAAPGEAAPVVVSRRSLSPRLPSCPQLRGGAGRHGPEGQWAAVKRGSEFAGVACAVGGKNDNLSPPPPPPPPAAKGRQSLTCSQTAFGK